jgi:hypothetical protein
VCGSAAAFVAGCYRPAATASSFARAAPRGTRPRFRSSWHTVRRARTTVVCDDAVANVVLIAAASTGDSDEGTGGAVAGKLGSITRTVTHPIVRAADAVIGRASEAGAALRNADRRLDDPLVLVILVLLLSVLSGCLLLAAQLAREAGYFER